MSSIAELLRSREWYKKHFKLYYYQPYEYQKKFHNAEGKGGGLATDRALIAANKIGKCATIDSIIDTDNGPKRLGDVFGTQCKVMAWDGAKKTPRRVLAWVQKPPQDCYRFEMSDGRWFECAGEHLILCGDGYRAARTFLRSLPASSWAVSRSARASGVAGWFEKLRDYPRRYWLDCRRYGEQLHGDQDSGLIFSPSLSGVPLRNRLEWRLGVLVDKGIRTLSELFVRFSSLGDDLRFSDQSVLYGGRASGSAFQWSPGRNPNGGLFRAALHLARAVFGEGLRRDSVLPACQALSVDGNSIVSICHVGSKPVFDMQVEELENYCAAGMVHHNTYCAAMEVAMHATGLYPDWWEGHRFKHRTEIMCGSESNELTRDVLQKELFGDPEDKDSTGTGTVPRHYVGKVTRKAGVPNAFDSVMVKHEKGGWSRVFFRAFEQGAKKHMGFHIHIGWTDEEPPRDIKSQYKRATLNTHGILINTFTPESGMTEVCNEYFNHPKLGMGLVTATWDDCPLFDDPQYKRQILDQFPEHEREMRSKGIPQMGSGLVFTTTDEDLMTPPFEIPRHWPRVKAVDFGVDHPFAAVSIAFDTDTETAYVYWAHRKTRQTIADNASAINSFDRWIPVVWPHDGLQQDAQSGKPLADIYREEPYSVNMQPFCFSNPPPPGKKEGQGGQGVEVGLLALDEAMKNGKFKVFSNCSEWFEEKRMYHRKDGLVVKERDDLMAATRYAFMSRRHASTEPVMVRKKSNFKGLRNW